MHMEVLMTIYVVPGKTGLIEPLELRFHLSFQFGACRS